jgi:acid phosphatase
MAAAFGMAGLFACAATARNPSSEDAALRADIRTVVVIYAENHSFDNLFGSFPGANGIPAQGAAPQTDRDAAGTVLPKLPQTWGGVTAPGQNVTVTQAQSDQLPNAPYSLQQRYPGLTESTVTRDLWHLFFEDQMQIDGGTNDRFAAWGDSGGLTMGHFDYSGSRLWQIARRGVLADNFFQGAFGGSFLNHQYLICACAPRYSDADRLKAMPPVAVLDDAAAVKPQLKLRPICPAGTAQGRQSDCSPASALDGPPTFEVGNDALAPRDYFGPGDGYRAVNTMAPPYQPSWVPPANDDGRHLYADPHARSVLMPQTFPTIGDLLTGKQVSWAWYGGAWRQAVLATTGAAYSQPPEPTTAVPPPVAPSFQYHHQPFNYYSVFDPGTDAGRAARAAHLKDYQDLLDDIAAGRLPQVVFYKPEGDLNQHPGYSDVANFDAHVGDLVARLQASPQYAHMLIIITYDEFGGQWDHVAPPRGDLLGPGTRIPAIFVSPYAKAGTVDHTQYDTGSISRLLIRLFDLPTLAGVSQRDAALQAHGQPPMGDLTGALDLHAQP